MYKICPNCKKEFTPKRKDQVYCSPKCRDLAYKRRKYRKEHLQVKICPACNKEFETVYKKKIYCSKKCRNIANRIKYKQKHKEEYLETNLKLIRPKSLLCSSFYKLNIIFTPVLNLFTPS